MHKVEVIAEFRTRLAGLSVTIYSSEFNDTGDDDGIRCLRGAEFDYIYIVPSELAQSIQDRGRFELFKIAMGADAERRFAQEIDK